jgi:LPS export ABC transporter protein LptC
MDSVRVSRIILLSLVLILMGLFAWVLRMGVEHRGDLTAPSGLITKANIEMSRLSLKQVRDGVVEWDIRAEGAALFEDRKEVSLDKLKATLLTKDGLRLNFSGDRGHLNTGTQDFEIENAEGNVTVSMSNGFEIQAPSLIWRDEQREIISKDPVRIVAQGLVIRGNQMSIRLDDQQMTVSGDVHVTTGP